jgi:hypothetical protein
MMIQNKKVDYIIPKSYQTYELDQHEKINYFSVCGLCLICLSYLFYQSIVLSLLFSFLTIPGRRFYCSYLAEKRKNMLKEQFKDVLYSISASISTGRQISEALQEAEQNMRMIYHGSAIIVTEISAMNRRILTSKESEEEILRDFAERSGIDDIANFVDIYFTCRMTGGDLIKVVSKATGIITDKMVIEKEIRTMTAQKRFEAKILTAIPFLILFFLELISPDYLAVLYEDIRGRLLMTIALFGIGFSYLWSLNLTRIEV